MYAISLFSSSGVGDLGLHKSGISTVVANEIIKERAELFNINYPNAKMFNDDIWNVKHEIVDFYRKNFSENPFLILATPPCQGMSSNGMGKMLSDYRNGLRPKLDERNRLIIPALDIIEELQPEWVILENVPNMNNTIILDNSNNPINIIDYIFKRLGNYNGKSEVINVADYGVAQNRKRLITILSKNESAKEYLKLNGTFLPQPTHSKVGGIIYKPWETLRSTIGDLPKLDAQKDLNKNSDFNLLHKVPLLDDTKYMWVQNTPEGDTAFNNQCINSKCMYDGNTKHGAKKTADGINKSIQSTPLYCEKCGELLPRPSVLDKKTGELRLMKGYVSAYKRMNWDEPSSTLTQNFQFACSDNKLHPEQNRVLSIYEALVIQTISEYEYNFFKNGKIVSDGLIRDTIGESVPPKVIELICKNILKISQL